MEMTDIAKLLMVIYEKTGEAENKAKSYEKQISRVGGDDNSVDFHGASITRLSRGFFKNHGNVTLNVTGDLYIVDASQVHIH